MKETLKQVIADNRNKPAGELYKAIWNAAIDEAANSAEMKFHCGLSKANIRTKYFQSGSDNLQIDTDSILKLKV